MTSDALAPERARPTSYRCRCVAVYGNARSRCPNAVTPDSPFCRECTDRDPRHHGMRAPYKLEVVPLGEP